MNFAESKQQYESEKLRLLDTLGKVTHGGIVESIRHIGATSVPGLLGSSCVDIGLAIWPFPLEAGPKSRLEALGYQIVDGFTDSPQQRFLHQSGSFQLFVFEPGVGDWYDFILVGDYLRHNDRACAEVSEKKSNAPIDRSVLFTELLPEARQWWIGHYDFSPLESIANEMLAAPFEWYVSGGWALDLFHGQVQRVHHDVDAIVQRSAQLELQEYLTARDWQLITPYEKRLELWPPHMRLELPRHQVHAHRADDFIDLLLTEMETVWKYRREPSILRSKEKMCLRSAGGIPYLAPELVLLFKSRNTSNHERAKDQIDFENTLPQLDSERRAWLRWALVATAPEHSWLQQL